MAFLERSQRLSKDKNKPREQYIIEDTENNYYILRKFHCKLRNTLYKALADELIAIPTPSHSPEPRQAPQQPQNDAPSLKLSKAGRPIRKAAEQAHKVARIDQKRSIFKHGWREEDQDFDSDWIYISNTSNHASISPHVPADRQQMDSSDIDTDSSQELSWDESPVQFQLSKSISDPPPSTNHSQPDSYQAPPRRLATSEQMLTRSDAFRCPPGSRKVQQSDTPQYTRVFHRSRIPCPISPTNLDLNQVADISNLPNPFQTPHRPPPLENRQLQRRRKIQQPTNYKRYGETGEK